MTSAQVRARPVLGLLLFGGLVAASGCGKEPLKGAPVSGKVTLDKKPLTSGRVSLVPDVKKGNTANVACVGLIGPEGEFEIKVRGAQVSDNSPDVPLGWYKVVYLPAKNLPPVKVDPAFLTLEKTPLSVEVVSDPKSGQYDVALTSH
jgi:hypothetical protein